MLMPSLRMCRSSAGELPAADERQPSDVLVQSRHDSDDGSSIAALHHSRRPSPAVSAAAAPALLDAAPSDPRASAAVASAEAVPAGETRLADAVVSGSSAATERAQHTGVSTAATGTAGGGLDVTAAVGAPVSAALTVAATGPRVAIGAPPDHFAAATSRVGGLPLPLTPVSSNSAAEVQLVMSDVTRTDVAVAAAAHGIEPQMPFDGNVGYSQRHASRRPSVCTSEPDITSTRRLAVSLAPPALTHSTC